MDDRRTFHQSEHAIDASPEEVWDVLTDPDGAWFGPGSRVDAEVGGELDVNDEASGTRRRGIVQRNEPGRRLGFTWWPEPDDPDHPTTTSVDIQLTPSGTGCRIRIDERPAAVTVHARSATARRASGATWTARVVAIVRCAGFAPAIRQG